MLEKEEGLIIYSSGGYYSVPDGPGSLLLGHGCEVSYDQASFVP
ncbi:hypothetical protein [Pasteuria penetrans]|nr:hypothetical protein [Pasteuria penetrans]